MATARTLSHRASRRSSGLLADRPAAGVPDREFFTTDEGNLYYDDGVTWRLPFSTGPITILNPGGSYVSGFDDPRPATVNIHRASAGSPETTIQPGLLVSIVADGSAGVGSVDSGASAIKAYLQYKVAGVNNAYAIEAKAEQLVSTSGGSGGAGNAHGAIGLRAVGEARVAGSSVWGIWAQAKDNNTDSGQVGLEVNTDAEWSGGRVFGQARALNLVNYPHGTGVNNDVGLYMLDYGVGLYILRTGDAAARLRYDVNGLALVDPSTSSVTQLSINGAANTSAGVNIELIGNGATTPKKYLRVLSGVFHVVNSGYSAVLLSLDDSGNLGVVGSVTTAGLTVGANAVIGTRKTGWTAATGVATRSTFATGSVTLSVLAEHVKALIDDLMSHGAIGA